MNQSRTKRSSTDRAAGPDAAIDPHKLRAGLAALLEADLPAGELRAGIVSTLQAALKDGDEAIRRRFEAELSGTLAVRQRCALVDRVVEAVEQGTPLRNVEFDEDEVMRLRGYTFLSLKPLLVVVNAGEADAGKLDQGAAAFGLEEIANKPHTLVVALSAQIEAEIAQLDSEDAASFRADLGINEPALERLIRGSYDLLGRISFFTVGEDECRAWTIRRGTVARKAAGVIHSDIERGFIRAELIAYDDLIEAGSWSAGKDKGTLRLEGKEYVMADGDVVNFRFNV